MQHVVSRESPPFRSASGRFEVRMVPAAHDNLVWLLTCLETGATAIIDGPDAGGALAEVERSGLSLSHVLNTHTHADHIGLNLDLQRRGLLGSLRVIGARQVASEVPGLSCPVEHGDVIEVGALRGRVLLTEGHIAGHLSFVFEDVVFCGDALFGASCGRVFTGDYRAMYEGLERLAALEPATRICCAHEYTEDGLLFARSVEPGNAALEARSQRVAAIRATGACSLPSTLQEELETNPFLRAESPELVEQVRAQAPEAATTTPLEVFTATRKLKDSGAYKRASTAGGAPRP